MTSEVDGSTPEILGFIAIDVDCSDRNVMDVLARLSSDGEAFVDGMMLHTALSRACVGVSSR